MTPPAVSLLRDFARPHLSVQPVLGFQHRNLMAAHRKISTKLTPNRANQPLEKQLTRAGKQLNATNADFLKIDVETALTFSGLALETDNEEKKQRNRKNARKAYDTILHLWGRVILTPSEEAYLHKMMSRLKSELEAL